MGYGRIGEIERMFYSEVADKKRIARGVHAMTGKRGLIGKMILPTDFMSKKEKKIYTQGGEIMTTNFYEDINNVPSKDQISIKFEKDPEGTKKMLETIKSLHTWKSLAEHWGYKATSSVGGVWDRYGIGASSKESQPKQKRQYNRKASSKEPAVTTAVIHPVVTSPPSNTLLEEQKNIFMQHIQNQLINVTKNNENTPDTESFSIRYNKQSVTGENIANRLSYIVGVLECDVDYEISLTIKERAVE